MSTLGLFKSFGIMMATRILPYISDTLPLRGKVTWMAQMMLTYYMRDTAKQLLLGRTPKEYDWTSPDTYIELATYSGMGGIYGDLIGADMSKFGPMGGAAGALAGPLITGPVQSLLDWRTAMLGDKTPEEKLSKTIQTGTRLSGVDHIPLVSPALNRIFIFSTLEALDPGWTQRHLGGLKSRGQGELGY